MMKHAEYAQEEQQPNEDDNLTSSVQTTYSMKLRFVSKPRGLHH